MTEPAPYEVTHLLQVWRDGNREALEKLTPPVYKELHRLAKRYMAREHPGHDLQTTALVNEAYLRLIDWKSVRWQNRAHFFGVSAQLMRRILVDFARSRRQAKRGGETRQVSLDEALVVSHDRAADLVALDDALSALATIDARKSRVVELRFFGGLSVEETAEVLGITPVRVKRDWKRAKAWLYGVLTADREHISS